MNYPTLEQHLTLWLDPDLAAAAAASWEQDMTVKTRAQLDALPDDTVVIADDGHVRLLCHRERSWVPLPARILHLPNPASGTTTPETPESPPRGDTDRKEDGLSINPATRITDLTVGQALKAAEVFIEGAFRTPSPGMEWLDMLWGSIFGGKR